MLLRNDLDDMVLKTRCEGCTLRGLPLVLKCDCHVSSGCEVSYVGNGVLQLKCNECKELVANIKISEVD
jgi:hypothetical protein